MKQMRFAALVGFAALPAYAGTYNFYFNNTEQGDDSTATPTVVVEDGANGKKKVVAPQASPSPEPVADAKPAAPVDDTAPEPNRLTPPEPVTPPELKPRSEAPHEGQSDFVARSRWWGGQSQDDGDPTSLWSGPRRPSIRLTLGIGGTLEIQSGYSRSTTQLVGARMAEAGVYLTKTFALTAFAISPADASGRSRTPIFGGELEWLPIHWEKKAFFDELEAGLILGGANWKHNGAVNLHAGGRITAYWFKRWGVGLTYRYITPELSTSVLELSLRV